MIVRKYQIGEELALWKLFYDTVHNINTRDYTREQVSAWAPERVDEQQWQMRIRGNDPYVCEINGQVVGFADLQESGYIDQFYVHQHWQGRGVGKRLFMAIEAEARRRGFPELTSNVSLTARPFFESRGFTVVTQQEVNLGTISLTNFKMKMLISSG